MLGRRPLVLGSVLLDTTVLGWLVLLAAGVAALGTLDMGVGSVTERGMSYQTKQPGRDQDLRSTEAVLRRDSLVGGTVLLEAVVLDMSARLFERGRGVRGGGRSEEKEKGSE